MKYFKYLTRTQAKELEYEKVSTDLKVHLTRLLYDHITTDSDGERSYKFLIIKQNQFINKARNFLGLPLSVLEPWEDESYHPADHAWHNGEFDVVFRRLDGPCLIEYIGDLVEEEIFSEEDINELLEQDGASFRYEWVNSGLKVSILDNDQIKAVLDELDATSNNDSHHHNIRLLIKRAEIMLANKDASGLTHAVASVYETLAKDIIADPNLENKSLGGFFEKYKKHSILPGPLLDYIKQIFTDRNVGPLSGHGGTKPPKKLTEQEMIVLLEMTKAFVKSEYILLDRQNQK